MTSLPWSQVCVLFIAIPRLARLPLISLVALSQVSLTMNVLTRHFVSDQQIFYGYGPFQGDVSSAADLVTSYNAVRAHTVS